MNKNSYKSNSDWRPYLLKVSIVLALTACQTISKEQILSTDRSFIVQWSYRSAKQKTYPVTSHIYIRGDYLLRMDFSIPFRGTIAQFLLNKDKILIRLPLKKEFYEGAFKSQIFLPQFDSFPSEWLFALLKAAPLKTWDCSDSEIKKRCRANDFVVEWIFKNSEWKEIYLISPSQEKIKIKKLKVLRKKLNKDIFDLSTESYKRQNTLSLE